MKRILFLMLLPPMLWAGGCAHVLSQEALRSVDRGLEYAEVKADPDAHKEQTLVVGGVIIDNRPNRESTTLEILRYTLDRWGEPRRADERGGRFLAVADYFLDPELYQPGRFVTMTGTVAGKQTRELEGVSYTYPVFRIGELHLWQQPASGYSYPYRGFLYFGYPYYGPYYDPWWPYGYYYGSGPSYWRHDPPPSPPRRYLQGN